jgi:ADP-heptose:LPS heptosyltransferase
MGLARKIERSFKRKAIPILARCIKTRKLSPGQVTGGLRRVLVIRQHNQMGDMLLAVPAFRAIKESFPGIRVGVVTSAINRDVLLNNPSIDWLYCYDKSHPFGHMKLIRAIRSQRFDLVIVLHTVSFSMTSVLLALLSGAAVRAGSASRRFGHALGEAVFHIELPLPDETELLSMNETEHNLYPLSLLGIRTDDLSPAIYPSEADRRWAEEILAPCRNERSLILAVHPGAGKRENVWPAERFAAVANGIGDRRPAAIVAIEGPRDAPYVSSFSRKCRQRCIVIRGRTIGEVAAVLQRSSLVLCNDTGIMHVACAAGAKTLAVFGPTAPGRWTPKCDNLFVVEAPGGALERLLPETVLERAAGLLELT